ncbi:hypothetical protein HPB50_020160 [Hyalomma asiaticum]|uniref:Uncharacterized protein n=1 Tax=Hyalomma asiaticum TaxID=266040 RepID=A0ACB7TN41_HYAAI|nr:hypothetical protein HPB50_020160 [Hyalomma asiaticum]
MSAIMAPLMMMTSSETDRGARPKREDDRHLPQEGLFRANSLTAEKPTRALWQLLVTGFLHAADSGCGINGIPTGRLPRVLHRPWFFSAEGEE